MNSNTSPASQHHADAVPDVTIIDKSLVKRAVAAASLGNAMEWFDFGIYGYLAVTLGMVFFPEISPGAQLLSTYAAFAVAFLIRPLGGMFFGPLGDRIGRKRVLALTMIMMALGTFAIGLIPSYASIGLWAPALLIVARGVQGFHRWRIRRRRHLYCRICAGQKARPAGQLAGGRHPAGADLLRRAGHRHDPAAGQ